MKRVILLIAAVAIAVGFSGCADVGNLIPEPSSDSNMSITAGLITPDNVLFYPFDLLIDWVEEMVYAYVSPDAQMDQIASNLLERTAEVEYCVKKETESSITTSAITALDKEVSSAIKVIPDCGETGKSAALTSLTTSRNVISSITDSYVNLPTNIKSMLTGLVTKMDDAISSIS